MSRDTLRAALIETLRDLRESGERSALSGEHVHMTDAVLADLILSDDRMSFVQGKLERLTDALDGLWYVHHHDMGHEGKREDCQRSNCLLSRAALTE